METITLKPARTLIFSSLSYKPHKEIREIKTLNPVFSRVEALYSKKGYFYCKADKTISSYRWSNLLTELGVNKEDLFLIDNESWINAINNIYYEEWKGKINHDKFFEWGSGSIQYSIHKVIKPRRISEGECAALIEDQIEADPTINPFFDCDTWTKFKKQIPRELTTRSRRIHEEVLFRALKTRSSKIKPSKKRTTLVINGATSTGKTRLSELIFQRLAERKILNLENVSWDEYGGTNLCKSIPWKNGVQIYEGIRFEEFQPNHFDFNEWTKLNLKTPTNLRVMRGKESTINLKVSIFTTVKPPTMWTRDNTNNISDLQQVTKRAYFTFLMHGKPAYSTETIWERTKDRCYLYGNVQHELLETIERLNPALSHEPLNTIGTRTELGKFIDTLYFRLFNDLINEQLFGPYLEDFKIEPIFMEFLYKQLDFFPPKIVRTFKYSQKWIESKIISYANGRFGLEPLKVPSILELEPETPSQEVNDSFTEIIAFIQETKEIYLDTETYGQEESKNWMSDLGLRTIQFGNNKEDVYYLIWEDLEVEQQTQIIQLLVNKTIYVYNLNFDASQLKHAGFLVEKNTWYDVAVLARLTYNDRVERSRLSLDAVARNYLKISSKKDYIEELKKIFKVRNKKDIYSAKGAPYNQVFKEYAINDIKLLIKVHNHLLYSYNYPLWIQELSFLVYKQWEVGFEGVKVDVKDLNKRIELLQTLNDKLLAMLPDLTIGIKSQSKCKGWNTPKIVDKWLRNTFNEDILKELEINEKSKLYSFDSDAREILIYLQPKNYLLKILRDFYKKNKVLSILQNIHKNTDLKHGLLRYNYKLAGTSTGRFTASAPPFHNFSNRKIDPSTFIFDEEKSLTSQQIENRYNLRNLLLKAEGTFSLDF